MAYGFASSTDAQRFADALNRATQDQDARPYEHLHRYRACPFPEIGQPPAAWPHGVVLERRTTSGAHTPWLHHGFIWHD